VAGVVFSCNIRRNNDSVSLSQPIQPGKTGILKVVFNTTGRPGPAHKTITVASNAYPEFPVLLLKGEVEAQH